ncbi:MAG TPA: PPOX class F420-dependent oxidoreductase [Actinomycetota bacterium]|nr:PPOX class F420-dependent oxidoreductase [Actinomycetota bacterium]
MTRDEAIAFIRDNHRAVLVTRRSSGSLQTSPITIGVDDDGHAVVSSRETAYKVRNLRRHPRATVCVFTDQFFGEWVQIDGDVDIASLPEAMEPLVDYYRAIRGEHPDWDEYRRVMEQEQRVLVRIAIEEVGPKRSG